MKLFCAYHGVAPRFDLLDRLGLQEKRHVEFQGLSTGQQRRLALALAVAHEPPVVFLGEPTAGLDVASRVELHSLMRELKAKGTTIILATHDMAEAEVMSDRVAILLQGKLVTVDTPLAITATGAGLTKISVNTRTSFLLNNNHTFPAVNQHLVKDEYAIYFSTNIGQTVAALISTIETEGDELLDLRVERPSLEDRFLELTTGIDQWRNPMNAFSSHFAFEFRTGIRNKNLLLMNYLFPLGLYVMMSLLMPGINPLFQETIIPSMITFGILASALLGLPDPLVQAREAGIFRSYKINGVPALNILLIPALSTILHILVVATIITVTAPIFFDAPLPVNLPVFALIVVGTAVALSGLGILIGVISPNARLTVLYSQVIFLPSMIIGGIMIPYSMLPSVAAKVALLLPSTYAMNAFNALAMGGTADFYAWGGLLTLFVGGLTAFILAWYLFRWDSQNTRASPPCHRPTQLPLYRTVKDFKRSEPIIKLLQNLS